MKVFAQLRSGFEHTGQCPKCGKVGEWRRGYEFDGEKRCATCKIVWVPDLVEEWYQEHLKYGNPLIK